MAEKLSYYEGNIGKLHRFRDCIQEKYTSWKEEYSGNVIETLKTKFTSNERPEEDPNDFSHIYRRKTRRELIRVSAAVMGIEFSYAAETAFVSPTLLKIGVEHRKMTLVWAVSPLVGLFLTPILGSMSDRCRLTLGRRRPFIIIMSIGVLLGLLLVPNGEYIGYLIGDDAIIHSPSSGATISNNFTDISLINNSTKIRTHSQSWGIFFTILGTVLLDFDADACQSPARAYLLDVTVSDDHAKGLSTFTIMAGLGGFFGYAAGGINWDLTTIGTMLGGHVRAVFTIISIIFIICVSYTITSFREIPLNILEAETCNEYKLIRKPSSKIAPETKALAMVSNTEISYGSLENQEINEVQPSQTFTLKSLEVPIAKKFCLRTVAAKESNSSQGFVSSNSAESIVESYNNECPHRISPDPPPNPSLRMYLKSIIFMPHSLRMLCLTNLFCWMAHVCYSLYFTDFVGEAVFNGSPQGEEGSINRQLYEEGIRFGCWGMSIYSLSCACYSFFIDRFIETFGARIVYIGGLLVYSLGMFLMAITKHKIGVIIFSGTAGIMYSTLFTMPYLLVAHYHSKEIFELPKEGEVKTNIQVRGMGTDVAVVSSMVFLAQFILSICMGTIITITGTTTAVVGVASFLAILGAISSTQIMYLDL